MRAISIIRDCSRNTLTTSHVLLYSWSCPCSYAGVRVHTGVYARVRACVRVRAVARVPVHARAHACVLARARIRACVRVFFVHFVLVLVFETSTDFRDRNNVNLNLHGVIHPFRFFFFQRSVDRTENEFWFNRCRRERVSIRETLGISPATTLNIYTCQFFIQTMIGHATLPWEYSESSLRHGVAIHHGTLPGGGMVTLDLGDNAVHEVIFYWSS